MTNSKLSESIENLRRLYAKANKSNAEIQSVIWKLIQQRLKSIVDGLSDESETVDKFTSEGYKLNISQESAREGAVKLGAHRSKSTREEAHKLNTIRMEKDGLPFYIQVNEDDDGCYVFIDLPELMKMFGI